MLSLSNGLIYPNYIGGIKPTDVDNLIGWWDFTDSDTMYTNGGSTKVSSDGDKIYRIDNKAYTLQGNTTNAVGKYLETLDGWEGFGNPYAPVYKTTDSVTAKRPPIESGSNPISYAYFYPETFTNGQGASMTVYPYLRARGNVGNVKTGGDLYERLTDSYIDLQNYTYFSVYRTKNFVYGEETIFFFQGFDPSLPSSVFDSLFGRRSWTRVMVANSNTQVISSENSVAHQVSASTALGPTRSQRTWRPMDLGMTNNDKFQFWTTSIGSNSATTTSAPFLREGRMYRNADSSAGINAQAYTSVSHTLDDSSTDASAIDGSTNKLNLGVGKSDDSIIRTLPTVFSIGIKNGLSNAPYNAYEDYGEGYENTYKSLRDAQVYEVIIFNRKLNSGEIAGIEEYLVEKYGDPTTL